MNGTETSLTEISSIGEANLPIDPNTPESLHVKGFIEAALCKALAKDKPLLSRSTPYASWIIVDPHSDGLDQLAALKDVVENFSAKISGLFTEVTADNPHQEQVRWAEAARVSLEVKNGQAWLLIDPDVWVWPPRARRDAIPVLDRRRSNRFNKKFNALLDAWVRISLGTNERNTEVKLSAFDDGSQAENPEFLLGTRTAFSKRLV